MLQGNRTQYQSAVTALNAFLYLNRLLKIAGPVPVFYDSAGIFIHQLNCIVPHDIIDVPAQKIFSMESVIQGGY